MASRQVSSSAPRAGSADAVADRLHSAAIHLLRRLRREDDASGQSAPRLSALSVLVFGGPQTIGALAAAEQVRVPTMSRVVAALGRVCSAAPPVPPPPGGPGVQAAAPARLHPPPPRRAPPGRGPPAGRPARPPPGGAPFRGAAFLLAGVAGGPSEM